VHLQQRTQPVNLDEIEGKIADRRKSKIEFLCLCQMLFCIIQHTMLHVCLYLFAEEDAGVEEILYSSCSILLIEVSQPLKDICVFEWLSIDVVAFDDAMSHLRKLLVISQ
jgi:hypothetical protein